MTSESITAAALRPRQTHPAAPAADVLALVLQGRAGATVAFGSASLPPHPFALLVAEAFEDAMTPAEWLALLPKLADPAPVLAHFSTTTWARFLAHFHLRPA
jgi:hypothetical protein